MTRGLEVILKVSERCNLDCSYCYYFNRGSSLYKQLPAILQDSVVDDLVDFVRSAAISEELEEVQFDLHGGEPMLFGVRRTRALCIKLTEELSQLVRVRFAIQTNAVLVSKEWCELFAEFDFGVGVSIDGSKSLNDKYRLDLNGEGSYDRAVSGLRMLQSASETMGLRWPTVLAVVTPEMDGRAVVDHLVDELDCRSIDLLLPDQNHDDGAETSYLSRALKDAFDAWIERDDPAVSIRVLRSIVSVRVGGPSFLVGFGKPECFAITVTSNGGLFADDTLRSCGDDFYDFGLNIRDNTVSDVFAHPSFVALKEIERRPLDQCATCEIWELCRGGRAVNRWSTQNGFNNKTVFCQEMKDLVSHIDERILT